ncbi:glucosaminidase domain-containing protein [Streptococcus fryi]
MKKIKHGKWLILLSVSLALFSLLWTTIRTINEDKAYAEVGSTQVLSTEAFIESVGETARHIGQEYDIYASVMIAQAILESASGQSGLSQAPYFNYFGIKGSYYGQSVKMLTWEDDGLGNVEHIYADFRSYGSPEASLLDYADLLSSPIYVDARKSNTNSYMDATAALTGLYATDTAYNQKLNDLIVRYGLTVYDSPISYRAESDELFELVWNEYRQQYTSTMVLKEDEAWNLYLQR